MNIRGFTLLEMAIVLLMLSIIGGGVISSVSEQRKARQDKATKTAINEIQEALIGYAVATGKLPCADTNGDGLADNDCTGQPTKTVITGACPYQNLGLVCRDGYENVLSYAVTASWAETGPEDLQDDGGILVGTENGIDLHSPARVEAMLSTGLYQEALNHYTLANRMVMAGRLP